MTWMITATGRTHHLQGAGMALNDPTLHEIAHALSQINRFTGHCTRPYSVAEHSLLVSDLAERAGATPIVQLAALMHDAHEAYTGDVSSPVKWAVGQAWDAFEHAQAASLHNIFGIRSVMTSHRAQIRQWDLVALATERRDLTLFDPATDAPWAILDTPGHEVLASTTHTLCSHARETLIWKHWRNAFTGRFLLLREAVKA
ncbi:MAG: hypothetical protein V4739_11745 [Pseudomonadota bacterium]